MAIIAVLVAIAVPLFVGEINRARETTFDANKRAAKSAVVTALLKDGKTKLDGTTELVYTVNVDPKTGDISTIKASTEAEKAKADTQTYEDWQENSYIVVKITKTDLTITTG